MADLRLQTRYSNLIAQALVIRHLYFALIENNFEARTGDSE